MLNSFLALLVMPERSDYNLAEFFYTFVVYFRIKCIRSLDFLTAQKISFWQKLFQN